MDQPRKIVLVGHCGPHEFMLKAAIERVAPGSEIVAVRDDRALAAHVEPGAVLLVNRVLDGRFDTTSGIDLIRAMSNHAAAPVSLLVSNFEDAQAQAIDAGARPGFGKRDLYGEATAERLREAIGGRD
jgi:hypothetical protein